MPYSTYSKKTTRVDSLGSRISKDFKKNAAVYVMALPVIAFFVIFRYMPMGGLIMAFKNYNPRIGILRSQWAGFKYFQQFLTGYYFWRLVRNTVLINLYGLLFVFPMPILLALLVNEVRVKWFKSIAQTISYLPHFISTVVFCGIIMDFVAKSGLINYFLGLFGIVQENLLLKPNMFRTIFISSDIWKTTGWGSIIYLAALTRIDPTLYEAAEVDGASRLKQLIHITIPGISPTIIIMLILRIGSMMSLDFEKVILLYNPVIYDTADVISSYVYRVGLMQMNFSLSTAVDFFNSIINFGLVVFANWFSRSVSETSLW